MKKIYIHEVEKPQSDNSKKFHVYKVESVYLENFSENPYEVKKNLIRQL